MACRFPGRSFFLRARCRPGRPSAGRSLVVSVSKANSGAARSAATTSSSFFCAGVVTATYSPCEGMAWRRASEGASARLRRGGHIEHRQLLRARRGAAGPRANRQAPAPPPPGPLAAPPGSKASPVAGRRLISIRAHLQLLEQRQHARPVVVAQRAGHRMSSATGASHTIRRQLFAEQRRPSDWPSRSAFL